VILLPGYSHNRIGGHHRKWAGSGGALLGNLTRAGASWIGGKGRRNCDDGCCRPLIGIIPNIPILKTGARGFLTVNLKQHSII